MDPHSFDSPSLSTPITFQPKAELILFDQPPTFLRDIPGDFSVTLPGVKHVTPLLIAHPSPLPPTAPGPSRPSRPHREPPERPPRGGRKFPCGASGCSRILTKQSLWKQHQRVHTHEKPFSCEFNNCGGKFANRFNLNRHYTTCKVKKALSSPTSTCVGSPSDDGTSI
ncbi:hypothetical protein FRB97_006030 [Tulasnella sp. 331]|nr:hypothetical protein FRB97_006030 [Tulasnella sp. 331]KAG8889047.1 hypothetical protein FRB98_005944 [Tulasnella sp. 332]